MSELLLQAIVEKLNTLEIALWKNNDKNEDDTTSNLLLKEVKAMQEELKKLALGLNETNEKIQKLMLHVSLVNCKEETPKTVKSSHTYHLHKGVWAAAGLTVFAVLFLYGWISSNAARQQFKAHDILYRYLKVNASSESLGRLYHLDSLYNSNTDAFTKQVNMQEQNIEEKVKLLRNAGEKK